MFRASTARYTTLPGLPGVPPGRTVVTEQVFVEMPGNVAIGIREVVNELLDVPLIRATTANSKLHYLELTAHDTGEAPTEEFIAQLFYHYSFGDSLYAAICMMNSGTYHFDGTHGRFVRRPRFSLAPKKSKTLLYILYNCTGCEIPLPHELPQQPLQRLSPPPLSRVKLPPLSLVNKVKSWVSGLSRVNEALRWHAAPRLSYQELHWLLHAEEGIMIIPDSTEHILITDDLQTCQQKLSSLLRKYGPLMAKIFTEVLDLELTIPPNVPQRTETALWHTVVVVGANHQNVYYNDPCVGQLKFLSNEDFFNRLLRQGPYGILVKDPYFSSRERPYPSLEETPLMFNHGSRR